MDQTGRKILWDFVESLSRPLPQDLFNNPLNIKCKGCGCWLSKRIQVDGYCPDCRFAGKNKTAQGSEDPRKDN